MKRINYAKQYWTVQEMLADGSMLAISDSGHWDVLPAHAGRVA